MKLNKLLIGAFVSAVMLFVGGNPVFAQQKEEGPDLMERAEMEADRLQRILELEDWQVFYVDSTLKHDYAAMIAESEALKESKVANVTMYQDVADKWIERIETVYKRIFTEEQWAAYLKSGAGKAIKAREKRKAQQAKKGK